MPESMPVPPFSLRLPKDVRRPDPGGDRRVEGRPPAPRDRARFRRRPEQLLEPTPSGPVPRLPAVTLRAVDDGTGDRTGPDR